MRKLIETTWTPVACDICGADAPELMVLGKRSARIHQKQNDYIWRHQDTQCMCCGFVFNQLRPEAKFLRDYYTDCWPIFSTSIAIEPDFDVALRLNLLRRWLKPRARLYEIGDKLGEFHAALVKAGYEVAGDDVMAEANERSDWLDDLFRRGCVAVPPKAMRGAFDAVLAYFVVEHLANPNDWLRSMRKLLAPEGCLVIEVPHFALHPKNALMHEHFLYLTPESLTALVSEAGYEIMETSDSAASRSFGFSLVARRIETPTPPDFARHPARIAELQTSYMRGREHLDHAMNNLAVSARLIAHEVNEAAVAVRVCFFGSNQTATEIASHLRHLQTGSIVEILPFDNSDAKTGIGLEGFDHLVQKPDPTKFDPTMLHVCVICSRGWTQAIATQIRGFGLPHLVLVDGAGGCLLPVD